MSRIVKLSVENIKRVQAAYITPTGDLVEITGKNGAGKSSVLDAIAMALGGASEIPSMPITRGHEKGSIEIDLGDLKVKRTFTKTGTTLIVSTPEGARFQSPQQILDNLTGKLTFDPLAFIRLKREDQGKALKTLVNLDFAQSDYDRRTAYDERTVINRDVVKLKAKAEAMQAHPDAPATEPSAADLVAELDAANDRNAAFDAEAESIAGMEGNFEESRARIEENRAEIERLESMIAGIREANRVQELRQKALSTEIEEAKFRHASSDKVDVTPIRTRIEESKSVILQVRANAARAAAFDTVKARQADADALTAKIDALDAAKESTIKAAKFPIEGLSFDDSGVIVDGIPFDQVNTAEQLRVSVAIAAAMNPKLRVMLIRHGNDLDGDGIKLLSELAAKHGLQVWIERIEGGAGAVVIEDGATKAETPNEEAAA